ncbi:hypothetical protein EW146_g5138 [Bondarzewia mesenterica]|uniref:Uncharacterized protein n=1 Tax=Bondarzewia mesenterica TaxID=1095465 RepID=A0A4S4LSZ2_9AGAM|nr:hypothetical protein EW146_g5138 [Bondarzewia mesenterica]
MSTSENIVAATLHYFTPPPDGSKPWWQINADPTTGITPRNYENKPFNVSVENVRGKQHLFKLDDAGFQYFRVPTKVTDFSDDDKVREEYYPEQADVLKSLTGASRVVIFDHSTHPFQTHFLRVITLTRLKPPAIRRHRPDSTLDDPQNRRPISWVHVDQTPASSEARVHKHLPASLVPSLLARRYQIVNLWRPISHTALDFPLALCDCRSVGRDDLVATTLVYPDKQGELFSVRRNEAHQWKYLRGMEPDEGVLIKWSVRLQFVRISAIIEASLFSFDSIQDGSVAILTPHTAFVDPTTPKDAPLRESIELRALVFYD